MFEKEFIDSNDFRFPYEVIELSDFSHLQLSDYTTNEDIIQGSKNYKFSNEIGFYVVPKTKKDKHYFLINQKSISKDIRPEARKAYTTIHELVHAINLCGFIDNNVLEECYADMDAERLIGYRFVDEFHACLFALKYCDGKEIQCYDPVLETDADTFVRNVNYRLTVVANSFERFKYDLSILLGYVVFYNERNGIDATNKILPSVNLGLRKLLNYLASNDLGKIDKNNLVEIARLVGAIWGSI